jgi:hypothetical protein
MENRILGEIDRILGICYPAISEGTVKNRLFKYGRPE